MFGFDPLNQRSTFIQQSPLGLPLILWLTVMLSVAGLQAYAQNQSGTRIDAATNGQVLYSIEVESPTQAFNDERYLTLAEAVAIALERNRELRATRSDQRASEFANWEAIGSYLPQIQFDHTTSETFSELFEFEPDPNAPDLGFDFESVGFTGTNYTNTFQLNQLIFDREIIGQIILSDLQKEAARWQTTGQEQFVVSRTVVAFLNVLRAVELLKVQEQRLDLAEEQLDTAQTAFEVGLRIRTDVLRAELTRSSAMRDVVSAEIAVESAQATLNNILGIPVDARNRLVSNSLADYTPPQTINQTLKEYRRLFNVAAETNPAIKVAQLLVEQDRESINIARGEFYPRVNFNASWGFNEQQSMDFEREEWRWSLGVTVPLFEGGRRVARLQRTEEELNAQMERYEDTVRSIFEDVEVIALQLQEEERNLEIALQAVEVAEENHERFLNLYQEGLADSLDVTQALTELVDAQINVVTTRYNYLSRYSQLLQSLGTIPLSVEAYASQQWLDSAQLQNAP